MTKKQARQKKDITYETEQKELFDKSKQVHLLYIFNNK